MKERGQTPTVVCRLSVGEAKVTDTGSWICELSNAAGKSSSTCNVKVVDETSDAGDTPPCFEQLLTNTTVTEFSDAVLKCKAVGNPSPDVKWFHNDVPIDPSFRHDMKSDSDGFQTLTMSGVKSADKGIYKVKFTNSAGWATCDAKVNITKKVEDAVVPSQRKVSEYTLVNTIEGRRSDNNLLNEADFLFNAMCDSAALKKFLIKWQLDDKTLEFPVHLRNKCQVEGSQAVLKCLVNGKSPFHVRWYKGNNELFEGPKYFIRSYQNIQSLEIPIVELEDTDHYTCVVRNDQGKIFTSCHLQIEPRLEKLSTEVPVKPFFTKPLKKQRVDEGELVIFRVAAKASPPPGFKWFKDGQELRENDRINIETLPNGGGQLTIHLATVRDIGLYVCEAHNHAGRARSMVRLSVRDKYEAAQEPPKKPIVDVTVSTKGEAETKVQQNGDIPHKEAEYEPHVETGAYSKAPILNAALPRTIVIRDRGRFFMECSASGFPKPKVTWIKNDQVIQEDEYVHFLSVGHWYGLEILDALPRHEGLYTVTLENSSGSVTSTCKVEMKLPREDPQFFHTTEESLERVFHKPVLQLLQTEFPWHQFDIPGLTPSFHLCNYEVDRTDNLTKESICLVDTLETPQFSKPLPDMVTPYEQDADLRLECQVGGKPCPKVVWLKDDRKLEDSDNISVTWDAETRLASLVFKSIKLEDSGKYSCIAYSDFGGHALSSTVMQVRGLDYPDKEKDASKRTLPEFKVKLADKEAAPGQEVRLEVKAEGIPVPEVTWFKNSEPITEMTEKITITSSEEGVHALVIPDVHISDSDCFKCEAKNEYGVVTTCAHVRVTENSDSDTGDKARPYFEEPLHSISVPLGQDAVFKCIAKGNPMPAFKWLRQGVTSIENDRVNVEVLEGETTLTIKKVNIHDEGLYYCFANNNDGTVKSCASLTITGNFDTNEKPIENNKVSAITEQKDHTLFEEKEYNDTNDEVRKNDVTVAKTENQKTESSDVSEANDSELKEATLSESTDNVANVKEITIEAETVQEIDTATEESVKTTNSEKPGQNSESQKSVEKEEVTEASVGSEDSHKLDKKENEVDKPVEEKVDTKEPKGQSQPVTENNEVVAETDGEKENINENKSNKDTELTANKETEDTAEKDNELSTSTAKESNISSDVSEEGADSSVQEQVVSESNKVEASETLKKVDTIESAKLSESKENACEIQETSNNTEENNTLLKPSGVSDSVKPKITEVPKFVSPPRSQWVTLNSPLELTFTAEKCEDLTVSWYKDGKTLKDDRFQMTWE